MNEEYSFMVDKDGNFYRVEYVPVVRCKDCKYSNQLDNSNYFICSKPFASNREAHTADWFCADGEHKESN